MPHLNSSSRTLALIIALFSVAASSARASAIQINAIYDSTVTGDVNAATIESTINAVILNYESMITNAITINVTFSELANSGATKGVVAQTVANVYAIPYSSYVSALFSHALSADDQTAIAHLSQSATVDPVDNQSTIEMRSSLVKALGISYFAATHASTEGTVSLNTSIMNLSRSGTQDSAKYDLQEAVSHELDEVLGMGSSLNPALPYASPEDVFRYVANGSGSSPCASVKGRSYSASAAACFSIDGSTGLAQFNNTGSGDAGDWLTKSGTVQVQDASGTPGSQPNLGVELRVLDVIGYDLTPAAQFSVTSSQSAATPEPATALLFAPLAALGLALRRRKN